jgi:hypothetical protein
MRFENGQPVPEYRVKALVYRFRSEVEEDRFDEAVPLTGTLGSFSFVLANGTLTATPLVEYLSREDAKEAIGPHLRNWEQLAFLGDPGHKIRFEYERSEVEEINPVPGYKFVFAEEAIGFGEALTAAVITRSSPRYPDPPATFRRTALTDLLVTRLRRVRAGEAELPATAYVVLTSVYAAFGQRSKAAKALAIEPEVLRLVGNLSSTPDPDVGRKAKGKPASLTGHEKAWLLAAMLMLIRRVGEHDGGGSLTTITLADLPHLA